MSSDKEGRFSARRLVGRFTVTKPWRRRAHREAFEDLFAVAPIPIVILRGRALVIELANEAALGVVGGKTAVGRPLLEVLPELDSQGCVEVLREVMASGRPHVREEAYIGIDERGSPYRKRYWSFTCARANGDDTKVVVVLADVTPQVVARTETEAYASEAEAASREKDKFFAMLSHELRNPLAPIVTALETMRLHGYDMREQALMERQVGHLVRLVDDLLDVSRIARGQVTLKTRPMEIGDAVAKAIEMVSPLLEERSNRLAVDVSPGLGVDIDPDRMGQVVSNLLTNAARYSAEGSRIELSARRDGGVVRLTVRDEGIGIEPERLAAVFEAFERLEVPGERPVAAGLGLGLTIVWNLVHLHGGAVFARSEGRGHGSEFVVELPWVALGKPSAAHRPSAATPGPRSSGRGRRVLVVDDNPDAVETLRDALASLGHDVRAAIDGPSALKVAGAFRPEVALIDLGLPVMDGYDLAERLKRLDANLHLIAVTGYGQPEDRRRTAAAGFEHHFVKPVGLDSVCSAIGSAGGGSGRALPSSPPRVCAFALEKAEAVEKRPAGRL